MQQVQSATYARLAREVIAPGLCTHCGSCAGLSQGTLVMQPSVRGPLPAPSGGGPVQLPPLAYDACPGKGLPYPELNEKIFGALPENWLIGAYRQLYIGYSAVPEVRRRAASGGVITQTLLYLLEQGLVQGAVVVRQGRPRPWQAEAVIARSAEEIRAASQSVYAPVPVNLLLPQMAAFEGALAYVGLPDQVAALRRLQQQGDPAAQKVKVVLGPYTGANMYAGAVESYLRANGVHSLDEVAELRYREGEWPGYLMVRTRSGRVLKAEKFYYNYLIPFYLTRSTLLSVDFTNELTDISVGDAWHPRYEAQGGGFSVVVARSAAGQATLQAMQAAGLLHLEEVALADALAMHGHMLDFKKRGAFIRMEWQAALGKPVPDYGYRPRAIPSQRRLVEIVIALLFAICGTQAARRLVEFIPIQLLGPFFNTLRKSWKAISKPSKRQGLMEMEFVVEQKFNTEETERTEGAERGKESLGGQGSIPANSSTAPTSQLNTKLRQFSALSVLKTASQLWRRAQAEIGHWRRREWSFAEVGRHWDATEDYDDINAETYSYFRRFVDGLRLSELPARGRVLDLCARTGNGTLYFYQHGKVGSAVCADVSARMGAICRQRLHAGGLCHVVWLPLFDYPLPLPDGEFDAVLCFETVEHFAQPEQLVAELGRVTRPGGSMILTTPNVVWEPVHALAAILGLHHSEGPHRFVTYRRLAQMIADAGFEIERAETTVLVPGGPAALVRLGEWMERHTQSWLMPWLGLRRVFVCRKK
jgi:coenzyme F420 hydrogenase subunit beta